MDKEFSVQVGKRIRELRENLNLSREKVSELSDLSVNFLGEIEKGQKSMSIYTLYKLANALRTSADYIIGGGSLPDLSEIDKLISPLPKKHRDSALQLLSDFIEALKK